MQRNNAMKKGVGYKISEMYIATERSIDCVALFYSE